MNIEKWIKMWEQLEDEREMRKYFEFIDIKEVRDNNHE